MAIPPPPPPEADFSDDMMKLLKEPPLLVLRCKIVLLGDSAVGKTSIAKVFQSGESSFPDRYTMTMGIDFVIKRVNIPETNVVVELYICDCGGFSLCQDLVAPHSETANAVMLVYDVANPESFNNLSRWYDILQQARPES